MKKISLLVAFAVCAALFLGSAVPVRAAEPPEKYDPLKIDGFTVPLTQELVVDKNAATANGAQFTFAVSGSGDKASGDPAYVVKGPNGAKVTTPIVYSDEDIAGAATAGAPAGKKIAAKNVTVDFSGVTFTDVGIYRYAVKQTLGSTDPIDVDPASTRYIDITVIDDGSGKLKMDSVVIRTAADTTVSGNKSEIFRNSFTANTLTIAKNVSGNQGSANKYFRFTVTLTKAGEDEITDTTPISVSGQDSGIASVTTATGYAAADINAANGISSITCADLAAGHDFYLKGGQRLVLRDIPAGYGYTVTEVPENYVPSSAVAGDTSWNEKSSTKVDDPALTAYTTVTFTNTREAPVSAGVVIAVAVPALLLASGAVGAGVILLRKGRKRR